MSVIVKKCMYVQIGPKLMWKGEYLILYSPVINGRVEVEWLPLFVHVTYRPASVLSN